MSIESGEVIEFGSKAENGLFSEPKEMYGLGDRMTPLGGALIDDWNPITQSETFCRGRKKRKAAGLQVSKVRSGLE